MQIHTSLTPMGTIVVEVEQADSVTTEEFVDLADAERYISDVEFMADDHTTITHTHSSSIDARRSFLKAKRRHGGLYSFG